MELNLEKALDGPVDLSHRFVLDAKHMDRTELVSLEPVVFDGRLTKSEAGYLLAGKIESSGVVSCARCLAPVAFSVSEEVTWVFSPVPEPHRGGELEIALTSDECDIVPCKELRFPFDPFIEEEIQLQIPLKSLCRQDCKGLCAGCGADLNVASCTCQPETDSRWGGLKGLVPPRG